MFICEFSTTTKGNEMNLFKKLKCFISALFQKRKKKQALAKRLVDIDKDFE